MKSHPGSHSEGTSSIRKSALLSVLLHLDPTGYRLSGTSSLRSASKKAMLRQIVSDLNFAARSNEDVFLPGSECGGRVISLKDASTEEIQDFLVFSIASLMGMVASVRIVPAKTSSDSNALDPASAATK